MTNEERRRRMQEILDTQDAAMARLNEATRAYDTAKAAANGAFDDEATNVAREALFRAQDDALSNMLDGNRAVRELFNEETD